MNYADIVQKWLDKKSAAGNDTIGLNDLIAANAADRLDPGKLDVNDSGQVTWRGRALGGPAVDFPVTLNAPGFWLGQLVNDGSTPFLFHVDALPSVFRSAFSYSDISEHIGQGSTDYLAAVIALTRDKLRPSNLLPADEIDRVLLLLNAGVVCVPATSTACQNLYRLLPDLPRSPVFPDDTASRGSSAWSTVISAYDEARKAYLNRQFDTAVSLAQAAAANADLWDKVYAAVEVVATPAILLGLAPESDNVKHLGWPTITFGLAGVAVAIGIGYLFLARKAV